MSLPCEFEAQLDEVMSALWSDNGEQRYTIGSVDASHVSLILVLRIPEQIGITDYCNDLRHQRCSKGCRKLEGH